MKTFAGRVDSMETRHAEFMARTSEMLERMDLRIAASEEETAEIKRQTGELKRRTDELEREARQHTLEWAQLAERFGRFAEDIVAPNIPRLAREVFGIAEIQSNAQRIERRSRRHPERFKEFDCVLAGQDRVILVETKATARLKSIEEFAASLKEFADYFPEYADHKVIPIFAIMSLSADFVRRLTRLKIYGMALGERTMELVNLGEVSLKRG